MILAVVLVGLVFLLLGAVIAIWPGMYVKSIRWQMKAVWAAEFKASKTTESRIRGLGFLYFLLGAVVLYVHLILGLA